MDRHTGFLHCFTHAGGKQARSPQLKRHLTACLIGLSTNIGLPGMTASCGSLHDVPAWTAEWYIREETLREANIVLVNYHHKLPMTAMFGSGPLPVLGPATRAHVDVKKPHNRKTNQIKQSTPQ
ncbi:Tn3 family transposase, partial [Streptomyces sp. NPDC005056]